MERREGWGAGEKGWGGWFNYKTCNDTNNCKFVALIPDSSETDNKTFYLKTNDSHQSLSGSHKFMSSTMRIEPNMTMMSNTGISNLPQANGQLPVNVTNVTFYHGMLQRTKLGACV
jgi:hypothetical protein